MACIYKFEHKERDAGPPAHVSELLRIQPLTAKDHDRLWTERPMLADAVIEIRILTDEELPRVGAALPLDRLTGSIADAVYLIAWEDGSPIGHAYLAWSGTELGLPELQDVFVTPERRGAGVGTALTRKAERLVAARGHERLSLSVGVRNPRARALYESLGYEPADHPPKEIRGTILLRSGPLEVDDTLLYYVKGDLSRDLSPDS